MRMCLEKKLVELAFIQNQNVQDEACHACPRWDECRYQEQRRKIGKTEIIVAASNYLFLGLFGFAPDVIIIDEGFVDRAVKGTKDFVKAADFGKQRKVRL